MSDDAKYCERVADLKCFRFTLPFGDDKLVAVRCDNAACG
jgi:hypothetical protein